jgi:hypothetical protein
MFTKVGIDAYATVLSGAPRADTYARGQWDACASWVTNVNPSDPYGTLVILHSKYYAPTGEIPGMQFPCCRYRNSTLDSLIDQMATMPMDETTNSAYYNLVSQALDILDYDLPCIPLVWDLILTPFNTHYWTNYATDDNLYTYGYFQSYAVGGLFTVLNIEPTTINTAEVYFTQNTPRFRGINHVMYGPFQAGDNARIPIDDGDYWVREGYASYTAPPTTMQTTTITTTTLTTIITTTTTTTTTVDYTMYLIIMVVIVIIMAAVIVILMRRK